MSLRTQGSSGDPASAASGKPPTGQPVPTVPKTVGLPFPFLSAVIAVVVIVGFAGFTWYLVTKAGGGENNSIEWARLMAIFASIEAIAFAAIGWLLGTNIEKQRSAGTERDLAVAKNDLSVSNSEREKARNAMERMRAEGIELRGMLRPLAQGGGAEADGGPLAIREILAWADRAFTPASS